MTELNKQDVLWILQTAILNYEGFPLVDLIKEGATPKHIILGNKTLEFIKKEYKDG